MNGPILFSLDNCTIVAPSSLAWVYAISVHGICCLLGGIPCGILLYYVLAKKTVGHKTNAETNAGNRSNATRTCICVFVGIVAASSIYVGRPVIETYSPNSEITFIGPLLASTFGFTTFFKSLNAAFGTYPEGADIDLQTWLLWFVMTPEPIFAKGKLNKANQKVVMLKIRDIISKIIALFLLLTVLMQHPPPYYKLLTETSSSSHEDNDNGDGKDAFDWFISSHVNGFFHLWLLYSYFSFCLDFSTITNYVASGGIRMKPGFCNPLSESRCFKETWGARWNRPVNELLKRTIYIPARKSGFCNQKLSAVLTFFASGLLHEYNFSIHNHRSYRPGEVTIFFLLMGILMIGESSVWNQCFPRRLQTAIDRLPSLVTASMLTFMVAGLAEHYFLRSWLESGFIEAVAQMLPYLSCQ